MPAHRALADLAAANNNQSNGTTLDMSNVSPTFEDVTIQDALLSSSPSSPIGYALGAGGAAVQATNLTTAVTINAPCGRIQTSTAAATTNEIAVGGEASFDVNNTLVDSTDGVIVTVATQFTTGLVTAHVRSITNATLFKVVLTNLHATEAVTSGAAIITFQIIEGVNA